MRRLGPVITVLVLLCAFVPPVVAQDARGVDDVTNGGFETAGGSGWTGTSSNAFNPFCTNTSCGPNSARSGTGFARLGSDSVAPFNETTTIAQIITLNADRIAVLSFFVRRATPLNAVATDHLVIALEDGSIPINYELLTLNDSMTTVSGWTKFIVDLTPFSTGRTYTLRFTGTDNNAPLTSWLLDDVHIVSYSTPGSILQDGGFEPAARAPLPASWNVKNGVGGEKVKCNKYAPIVKIVARSDECALMLKPGVFPGRKLIQQIPGSALDFNPVSTDDIYAATGWSRGDTFNITLSVKPKYLGTPVCPRGVNVGAALSAGVKLATRAAGVYLPNTSAAFNFPCMGEIKKIKLTLRADQLIEKTYVDDVRFLVFQQRLTPPVLPLPPSPSS